KNQTGPYGGATSTGRGADLNRNFPFQWACCGGSSASPCSDTYHGAAAASEPEGQAARSYAVALWPSAWVNGNPPPSDTPGLFLDIHSYGQLVLWPWGSTTTVAPNGIAMQTLGRNLRSFCGTPP